MTPPADAYQQELRCAVRTLHMVGSALPPQFKASRFPRSIVQITLPRPPMMKPLKIRAAMINRAAMMAKGAR